jgi:hypothetical protein
MAVQTKILKRTETFTVPVIDENGETVKKPTSVATGALVGGVPGQIYDVAFGPVVHTTNLSAAAEIGSYVEGQGVIINAPEYALYGTVGNPLAATLMLPANSVVSVMTAGHVWIQYKNLAAIQAGMNTFVMFKPADAQDDDLCVVEVNGLKPQADADDSTANG